MERDSHGNFPFSQVETEKSVNGPRKRLPQHFKRRRARYRLGIKQAYFQKTLARADLDPEAFGPLLFENYGRG